MILFIENDGIKKEYATKGFARCQGFRWEKTVDAYLSVLIDK
jgi:hypothetical protein